MVSGESETVKVGAHRLTPMLEPRSIALIGASEKSLWTQLILRNYRDFGYDGRLFAVNRQGIDVGGMTGYASCRAIGEPIDLAFITVPIEAVVPALEDAAEAGARAAMVLTSGFAESGAEGAALQERLVARARELGVALWGPNSLGYTNVSAATPVSVIPAVLPLLPPSIAIVSQSGASAAELNEFAHSQNIGTSFVAATGNEADVTLADVVDYLVDDDSTKAIAIFAEGIRDPAAFERFARHARARRKPIVILKVGRSALAGAVAQAHTGSLAGDDVAFDAVCERLGVIRVDTPEALIVTAGMLAATGPLPRDGVAFASISGGACTLAADAAEAVGVALPANDPATVAKLREALPAFASTLNPLDVTGAAMRQPDLFEPVVRAMGQGPAIGLVAISMTVPTMMGQGVPATLAAIGRAVATLDVPAIMVSTTHKTLNDLSREAIAANRLPHVVNGVRSAFDAIARAIWWSGRVAAPAPKPLLLHGDAAAVSARPSGERETLAALAAAGVPVVPATVSTTPSAAGEAAAALGEPVVIKILSPDIQHKTEVGGVRLDVAPDAAEEAAAAMLTEVARRSPAAAIEGVIVSPMRRGGLELLVGVTRDPTWGLMVTVALGGVLVEVLTDSVTAPLPVDREEVKVMLARLRGAKLLAGYRGQAAADLDRIADAVVGIARTAAGFGPALQALEVNPLLVSGDRVEALDALAIWA